MYLKRIPNETEASSLKIDTAPNKKSKASVNFYLAQLYHINERDTREIAKVLDQPLNNLKFKKCEPCAKAKASRKSPKVTKVIHKPKQPWDGKSRVFLDISTLQRQNKNKSTSKKGRMNKPHWRILVDERTQMKFSHFLNLRMT